MTLTSPLVSDKVVHEIIKCYSETRETPFNSTTLLYIKFKSNGGFILKISL